MSAYTKFETVKGEFVADHVLHVQLNRPKKLNSFNPTQVSEIGSPTTPMFLIANDTFNIDW